MSFSNGETAIKCDCDEMVYLMSISIDSDDAESLALPGCISSGVVGYKAAQGKDMRSIASLPDHQTV